MIKLLVRIDYRLLHGRAGSSPDPGAGYRPYHRRVNANVPPATRLSLASLSLAKPAGVSLVIITAGTVSGGKSPPAASFHHKSDGGAGKYRFLKPSPRRESAALALSTTAVSRKRGRTAVRQSHIPDRAGDCR